MKQRGQINEQQRNNNLNNKPTQMPMKTTLGSKRMAKQMVQQMEIKIHQSSNVKIFLERTWIYSIKVDWALINEKPVTNEILMLMKSQW